MEYLPTDENFLGIDDEQFYAYDRCRFVVHGVPYEHTSSYRRGSAEGPAAILRASRYVEFYDEELDRESYREGGISTLPALELGSAVDEAAVAVIEQRTARLLADGKLPVMLGAEHTVTLGAVRAVRVRHPGVSVLQIDAHSDLRQSYEGNRYSHASVMARVHDLGVPLVQVGIRAQSREEAELIRSSDRIHTIYAHHVRSRPRAEWVADAVAHLTDEVYVSIDADGFDPSVIPAVGTAEPGGLTWDDGLTLLRAVCRERRVVGFDVVEVAPEQHSTVSEYTLAKLVYKLIGMIA